MSEAEAKLNLGAGAQRRPGYTNLDWNPANQPDVLHDLNHCPYPFADNTFSLVEACHVLEHLDRPFEAMREMHRILKPGARLIVKVPHCSRGFTHAEHQHGFDVTFPLYFDPDFSILSGYAGVRFELVASRWRWLAFLQVLPKLGYGPGVILFLRLLNGLLSGLANLAPHFCSRIWCFWVGGFEEISFEFICRK
jgi:SAM-dependent methyltransferase